MDGCIDNTSRVNFLQVVNGHTSSSTAHNLQNNHHSSSTTAPYHLNGFSNHHHPPMHNQDVYTNSDFDPDDSLEGTSVDDGDSDRDPTELDSPLQEFQKAEEVVAKIAKHLQVSRKWRNSIRKFGKEIRK